jgi:transketolase
MRNTFVNTLLGLARKDPDIVLITGDLGFGVLTEFWKELPRQFINAGIAEQNMTGVAAGLALEGKTVFTYSIANFPTLRCLEQIRNDAAYHRANVKVVSVGAGMAYGSSGMSHHATEDVAVMRALPDLAVFSPGDPLEAKVLTEKICKWPGACYLRLGKGKEKAVHGEGLDFEIGKAVPVLTRGDAAIFASGAVLENAHAAACRLGGAGAPVRLYSFPTVKPLDAELIRSVAREVRLIVTVEEHNLSGGFGGAVAEVLCEMPEPRARLLRLGLPDCYVSTVGSQEFLRELYGLSPDAIARAVTEA